MSKIFSKQILLRYILSLTLLFSSLICIILVLKLNSQLSMIQKKNIISLQNEQLLEELKSLEKMDLDSIESPILNKVYQLNKTLFKKTGKNFLEDNLFKLKQTFEASDKKDTVKRLFGYGLKEIEEVSGEVKDPFILAKFKIIEKSIQNLEQIEKKNELKEKIKLVLEEISSIKEELVLQRKVKIEGGRVLSSINTVEVYLQRALDRILPAENVEVASTNLKKDIRKAIEVIDTGKSKIFIENDLELNRIIYLMSWGTGVFAFVLFVALILLMKKNNFNEKNEYHSEKNYNANRSSDSLLGVLFTELTVPLAVTNKDDEITWSNKAFLSLYKCDSLEVLSKKFNCTPPLWTHLKSKSKINSNLNLVEKEISSLFYSRIIQVLNEDQPPVIPIVQDKKIGPKTNQPIDLVKFTHSFVSSYNRKNILIGQKINLTCKMNHSKIYSQKEFTMDLEGILNKIVTALEMYSKTIFVTAETELDLEQSGSKISVLLSFKNVYFKNVGGPMIINDRVYPSFASGLRTLEAEYRSLGISISLKNLFTNQKMFKSSLIKIDLTLMSHESRPQLELVS